MKELPAANADLLSALLAAGNLTDEASTIVEIRKVPDFSTQFTGSAGRRTTLAQDSSVRIDLIAASQGVAPDYRIEDGSVIMVREREPKTIQVIGLVNRPNQFEIPPDEEVRLLDAIALANGRTLQIADKVHVIRQLDSMKEPVLIAASIRDAKRGGPANLRLGPGDIVSVEETPLTFTVGTIQSFVRFGFSSAVPGL
jgi:protein involved in polysaccharide export with SLBB domain